MQCRHYILGLLGVLLLFAFSADGRSVSLLGNVQLRGSAQLRPAEVQAVCSNNVASPLLYEDFENPTGYTLPDWAEVVLGTGVVNEDYTATVLDGTQSLLLDKDDDNPDYTTNSFVANGHVWVAFRLRPVLLPSGVDSDVFSLLDDSDNCQLKVTLNSDGDLKVWPQCGTSYQTAFGLSINTTYTIWVEYNKDNGANSYASIAWSTGSIRPTSGDNFADGTSTSSAIDVSLIRIGDPLGGQEVDFILDHLIIDDEQIPDCPYVDLGN